MSEPRRWPSGIRAAPVRARSQTASVPSSPVPVNHEQLVLTGEPLLTPTEMDRIADLNGETADSYEQMAVVARLREARYRAVASALRGLQGDETACDVARSLAEGGWSGTAEELMAVARHLTQGDRRSDASVRG